MSKSYLCGRAILLALLASLLLTACGGTTITEVPATKAKAIADQRRGQPDFIILDIRTPKEFNKGHIEGAINIDFNNEHFKANLEQLDKNPTYLLYCRSGGRTGRSLPTFKELGFKDILHISRGIQDWNENKFPLVKGN